MNHQVAEEIDLLAEAHDQIGGAELILGRAKDVLEKGDVQYARRLTKSVVRELNETFAELHRWTSEM